MSEEMQANYNFEYEKNPIFSQVLKRQWRGRTCEADGAREEAKVKKRTAS